MKEEQIKTEYIKVEDIKKYLNPEEWKTPDEKWWPEREIGILIELLKTEL